MFPLADGLSRRARLLVGAAAGLAAVAYLVQVLQVVSEVGGIETTKALTSSVHILGMYCAGLVVLARAVLVAEGRVAWLSLSGGILASATAGVDFYVVLADVETRPYPALSDYLWLLMYPATYVTLGLLARAQIERFHKSMWLDGLIALTAVAALSAAFVLGPLIAGATGSRAAVVTSVSYPVADLILLGALLGILALRGWRLDRMWSLLAAGVVLMALLDTLYVWMITTRVYEQGTLWDSGYLLAYLFMAAAAWQRPVHKEVRISGWGVLAVPALFTLASIALLFFGNFAQIEATALLLATSTILLALVRTGFTFHEVRSLADSRRLALTDELTGLPNRRSLYDQVPALLGGCASAGERAAIVMLDLDGFKQLNDTLGHRVGDLLLAQVGPRLAKALPDGALLTRLGGDEFAMVLPGVIDSAAVHIAQDLREALNQPYDLEGLSLRVDGSFGIAMFPQDGENVDILLQRADVAMYHAKDSRAGTCLYLSDRDTNSLEQLALVNELRLALERNELVLHYQPKADARTAEVVAVEGLVRWEHPERGLLGPFHFLPTAEQSGLMPEMTVQLLRIALKQAAQWRADGHALRMALNISTVNLLDTTLPAVVTAALAEAGVPARNLILEITEDTLMADPKRAALVLEELRALGISVSIDDYGTGYSSLAYLKNLAADELKIDRAFISALTESETDELIVASTINLAHSLGMSVVAEGVEDAATWEKLTELNCDQVQGYHVSRPAAAEEITRRLARRPGASPLAGDARPPAALSR